MVKNAREMGEKYSTKKSRTQLRFRNIQIERLLVSTARVFQVYAKGLLNEMSNRHNSEVRINTTNGSYYTGLFFCVLDCLCGHSIRTPFRFEHAPPT